MKYISRFAALLMALMMVVGSAGALTLGDLTEEELAGLYQAAAENYSYQEAGVLGEWLELNPFSTLEDKGTYTFRWYDKNDIQQETTEEPYVLRAFFTREEQRYYCVATDTDGNSLYSEVFVIPAAQMTNMGDYVGYLANIAMNDEGYYSQTMVCQYLTDTWNVETDDGNLGARVVAEWQAEWRDSELCFDMICSCVVDGLVAADHCVLAPDAKHDPSCMWYKGTAALNLKEGTDETGKPSYTLYITVNSEDIVLAVSEMLDGQHHYFRDVRQGEVGLYVAWLYIDEEGNPWLMPLESERGIPAE